ncbi:MAG: acyl-CoA hydrolase [Clostridia bacterium]|nr:acyl-CoA hydrolase [Clostridia bacterium]
MTNNISFSRAETCMFMEPGHGNPYGNVHGGELMKIMANTAGIAAARHAKGAVTTARVDEIVFHKPIHVGDIITCSAQLAYAGTSSMQIMVSIDLHCLDDDAGIETKETAATAFFTIVHLKDKKPAKVPELIAVTKEEEALYRLGEEKYKEIKARLNASKQ